LLAALGKNEMLTIGLDESQQMGQVARRRLLRTKVQPNLVRGSAFTLPFADAAFEQVIMTFPAEFLLIPQTFAEIHRILVNGGRVIILPIAWITGRKPWERLAAWVNRVTGEAPEWDGKILEPLTAAGFTQRWEILEFASSKLLLVFLQKSAISPAD
jgi:ubiquinone/menaquinone biosynthesis C-methylase UbiE